VTDRWFNYFIYPNFSKMVTQTVNAGRAGLPSENPTASFWLSQPSGFLLGHKTTPSLPSTADVIIIGSGISGASAAYHLAQDGSHDVLMLEAREACWGATGRVGLTPSQIQAQVHQHQQDIDIKTEWRALPAKALRQKA
jgi:hypothetical protein